MIFNSDVSLSKIIKKAQFVNHQTIKSDEINTRLKYKLISYGQTYHVLSKRTSCNKSKSISHKTSRDDDNNNKKPAAPLLLCTIQSSPHYRKHQFLTAFEKEESFAIVCYFMHSSFFFSVLGSQRLISSSFFFYRMFWPRSLKFF